MVLHAMHNGLVLSILYYRDQLRGSRWDVPEQSHFPLMWHVVAVIGIVIGAGLLVAATRRNENRDAGAA